MKMWKLCLLFIFPLLCSTLGEDTVAEDVGVHQLQRLVELLTHKECEDLLVVLSQPEENIFQHLERLSPGKNQLDLKPRAKRDTSSSEEVGTNINEDKTLNLKRYVDDYHKYVSSLNVPSIQSDANRQEDAGHRRKRKRKVKDLSWRDLDLVVEVGPVPPYLKGPLDVVLPVLYGVLLGFGGSLFVGVSVFLIAIHVSHRAAATAATGSSGSKLK